MGADVKLAVPEDALEQEGGRVFLRDVFSQVEHIGTPAIRKDLSAMANAKSRLEMVAEIASSTRVKHVYVPYADGLAQAWGAQLRPSAIFRPDVAVEGLMMRGVFAYTSERLRSRLASVCSLKMQKRSRWTQLHYLDPLAWTWLRERGWHDRMTGLLPELIDVSQQIGRQEARDFLKVPQDVHLVCCPGGVSGKKGSRHLIEAINRIDTSMPIHLLLIGKIEHRMREWLTRQNLSSRITVQDRFSNSDEFAAMFVAADTVAVCYPRHVGSASILLIAAKLGRRVVSSDWGWLGWATRAFNLGITCDATSAVGIELAMHARLAEIASGEEVSVHANSPDMTDARAAFLEFHSPRNHRAHWTRCYRDLHGLQTETCFQFSEVAKHLDNGFGKSTQARKPKP
ncbi:hypothetical protein CGZ80_05445 [Rhodopirellula sp. MGV]|nr:hypothetical protein CGZ80_05445 [Rhodopirellula sp. MGV]PNY36409.1 glycosyltransferase family 1 protein [Rhodopirellula baltica]